MYSAPAIRKRLLNVIEEKLLPTLQHNEWSRLLLAEMPMQLPQDMRVTHLPVSLLPDATGITPQFGQNWPEAHVHNFHQPYLAFICEGAVDFRVGTTQSMARQTPGKSSWTKYGCHILHLQAPTFLLIPPGVPYSTGEGFHWEGKRPVPDSAILWIHSVPEGALCHLCSTVEENHRVEHSLLLTDASLSFLIALLREELREQNPESYSAARHSLIVFLLRLCRQLKFNRPNIGNTAWSPPPEQARGASSSTPLPENALVQAVDEFVLIHMSEPISLAQIAAHCKMSPAHLNRLFRGAIGMSVKKYVNQRRMMAAATMLREQDWPIKEIARLMGFAQHSHFCQSFQKSHHLSPTEYRTRFQDLNNQ